MILTASSSGLRCLLLFALQAIPLASAQLFSLAPCVQKCLDSSGSFQCGTLDFPCICGAAAVGDNLVNLAKCSRETCATTDVSVYVSPLSFICSTTGHTIPQDKINTALQIYTSGVSSSSASASTSSNRAASASASTTPMLTSSSAVPSIGGYIFSTTTMTTTDSSGSSFVAVVPLVNPTPTGSNSSAASATSGSTTTTTQPGGSSVTSAAFSRGSSVSASASGPTPSNGGSPFQQGGAFRNGDKPWLMAAAAGLRLLLQ